MLRKRLICYIGSAEKSYRLTQGTENISNDRRVEKLGLFIGIK